MKPKKQTKVKARKVYAITAGGKLSQCHLNYLMAFRSQGRAKGVCNPNFDAVEPIFILPATAEAYDAIVEQAARLMQAKREKDFSEAWDGLTTREQENRRAYARLCLKAIGIARSKEDGK